VGAVTVRIPSERGAIEAKHEPWASPADDANGVLEVHAGFLPPLQGLLVGACDPGAASRFQRALPRAIPFRPSGAWGGNSPDILGWYGLWINELVDR
jgi:hypothetical protein